MTKSLTRLPWQGSQASDTRCRLRHQLMLTGLITALCLAMGCQSPRPADESASPQASADAAMPRPVPTKETQQAMSPQDALTDLKAGNVRFAAGQSQVHDLPAKVRATASGQYPFAVILSCLDSRMPVEMIFDQSIGEVFNARVAGNVLNDDILGSLEFACKASGAKLIVVLGHSSCGAVRGAVDDVKLGNLTGLLSKIKPAVAQVPDQVQPRTSKNDQFVQKVAEANVHLVMHQIREQSPILRGMLEQGQIGLVGGMYDLSTGKVEFYSE